MSSRAVRNTFRGWAATLSVPFHDTINRATHPADAIWCTARFEPTTNTRTTFCDTQEEEGSIELLYSARPGIGDDAVLQAAEADISTMMAKVDASGKFVLTGHEPPDDASFGDADATYRVSVNFSYVFYK